MPNEPDAQPDPAAPHVVFPIFVLQDARYEGSTGRNFRYYSTATLLAVADAFK